MGKSLWEDITFVQELSQHEMTNRQRHRSSLSRACMYYTALTLQVGTCWKFHTQIYLIFSTYFHIYFLFFLDWEVNKATGPRA